MPNDQDKLAFVTNVFVTGVIVGVVTLKKLVHICCILSAAYVIQNKVYINCQTSVSKM